MKTARYSQLLLLAVAALSLVLGACGRFQSSLDLSGSEEKTVARHDDQSENKADEGEALLVPQTLDKARGKFLEALELNPENARALFWRDTVDMLLEFKGIITRIRPLYEATPEGAHRYAMLQSAMNPRYSDAQMRFLQAGHEDIRTAEDAAEFIDRMRLRVYKLRTTIRSIRDTEMTLTLPKELMGEKTDHAKTACGIVSFGPVKFRFDDQVCSGTSSVPFGVNRADFNALLQILGYYQVLLDFWTAYRVNPVAFHESAQKPFKTSQEVKAKLNSIFSKRFDGSLSRPKPFIGLKEVGSDIYQALRYEAEHQKELCPAGYPSPNNRKGYLLSTGSCTFSQRGRSSNQRTLDVLEMFLAGQPIPMNNGELIHVESLIQEPPQSLNEFLPFKVNKCAQIVSFNTEPILKIYPAFSLERLHLGMKKCEVQP